MAVMNNMREYTKVILIILVLAFIGTIIFDWGMNVTGLRAPEGVAGKIEGHEISARQFNEAYAREIEQYRNQTGNEPSEAQLNSIRNRVWESFVQDILIQKELQKMNIKANDQEIVYHIYNDPPPFLRSNPSFQNEQNQFDMAKYQAALSDPTLASQWRPVEEYLRQALPYEKFQQKLRASVRVTEHEVKRAYLKQNQEAQVKYIFFNPNDFINTDIEITEKEIEEYYDNHTDEFRDEEKRKIDYVIFPTEATAEDSAAQRDLAKRILERAKEGEDFAALAEIYSEDTGTKEKGGDLGYFGKDAMVKPFEEAAFNADVGEIVGPVKSQFGLHIIKVEDKRTTDSGEEEVKARHILFKFEPSRNTTSKARDDAEYFAEQAQDESFEQLADEFGLTVQTTNPFPKGSGFVPGIGLNPSVSNFVFSNEVGEIGDVEETARGFFIYQIAEVIPERTKPLSEVEQQIENQLKTERRMDLAGERAQRIYEKVSGDMSLQEAASQDTLEVKQSKPFTRSGFVQGVGQEPGFIGAAFALENPGDISPPVKATRGYYLIELVSKEAFDETDFQAQKEQLKRQLMQSKQSQVFANWYVEAKEKADIEDMRERLF